ARPSQELCRRKRRCRSSGIARSRRQWKGVNRGLSALSLRTGRSHSECTAGTGCHGAYCQVHCHEQRERGHMALSTTIERPETEPAREGVWSRRYRGLTLGLTLTVSFAAFENLAVATVMPAAVKDLGGLTLYGWAFSAFSLSSLVGIVAAGREAD